MEAGRTVGLDLLFKKLFKGFDKGTKEVSLHKNKLCTKARSRITASSCRQWGIKRNFKVLVKCHTCIQTIFHFLVNVGVCVFVTEPHVILFLHDVNLVWKFKVIWSNFQTQWAVQCFHPQGRTAETTSYRVIMENLEFCLREGGHDFQVTARPWHYK